MDKKLKYYELPKDENNNYYWVPVVIKNKDTLVGLLKGMHVVFKMYNIPPEKTITPVLGSDRFCDLLPNGKFIHDMSKDEYKGYIRDLFLPDTAIHQENNIDMGYAFNLECTCGNFYGFKKYDDLPAEKFYCGLCEKILIDYIEHDDNEYRYEGKKYNNDMIISEVIDDLDLNDD